MKKSTTDKKVLFMAQGALIAALYVVLTVLTNIFGLANNPVQLRLSEALTVLPFFTSAAIPGLFVGCLISNLLTGCIIWDVIFGSVATIVGALGTYFLRRYKYLAPIPPILANTIIMPLVLAYAYQYEGGVPFFMLTVGAGEIASCGILGILLMRALDRLHIKWYK